MTVKQLEAKLERLSRKHSLLKENTQRVARELLEVRNRLREARKKAKAAK